MRCVRRALSVMRILRSRKNSGGKTILFCRRFVVLSHCRVGVLSRCYIIALLFCRVAVFSYCRAIAALKPKSITANP
jgi:hypothetical protein